VIAADVEGHDRDLGLGRVADECSACGAMWAGGSTVLMEHDRVW
jgi:hypothetical protein